MKKGLLVVLFSLFCLNMGATAQIGERLVWNGEVVELFSEPLSLNDSLYKGVSERLSGLGSTALWRGYVGSWTIENDSLFLDSICQRSRSSSKMSFEKVDIRDLTSGYKMENSRIFASWVTDTLRVVSGECVNYVHMGWESTYEKEWNVVVERGVVKNIIAFNNAIVIEGGSEPEIMETLNDFPIEKYPSINRVHVSVKGVKMDSVNNEISYDLEVRSKNLSEEVCEGIISDFQDLLKAKKFIRVYNANGELKCKTCIIPIVRKRIEESRRR